MKPKPETREEAWRLAAEILVDGCEARQGWSREQNAVIEMIRNVVVPAMHRKAESVRTRRKGVNT